MQQLRWKRTMGLQFVLGSVLLLQSFAWSPNSQSIHGNNESNNKSQSLTCSNTSTSASSRSSLKLDQILDAKKIRNTLQSGRAYVHPQFLSPDQVAWLRRDLKNLEAAGGFTPSGLTDTRQSRQSFTQKDDRAVCPVPWFPNDDNNKDWGEENPIAPLMHGLRHYLADILDRPTMHGNSNDQGNSKSIQHECYYSTAGFGAVLPRHMDERHEDLKTAKMAWLLPSRRSVSWLLYLSRTDKDDESDNNSEWTVERHGGALRTFPQRRLRGRPREPSHQGNFQVAWLLSKENNQVSSVPVFLDSWYRTDSGSGNSDDFYQILYTLQEGDGIDDDKSQQRRYLTHPWLPEKLPPGMALGDFLQALSQLDATSSQTQLFLDSTFARQFHLLEDRQSWDDGQVPAGSETIDVAPSCGTLVMFDSVMLPHQVQAVTDHQAQRVALAGWFHEATPDLIIPQT